MENQKFKLQQVFLGSKRFNYAHLDMKEYVHVSKNGIEFRLPNFFQDKRNRIQVPIETLNELSLYTTGSDYNGNDANMGYLVIEPKDSV